MVKVLKTFSLDLDVVKELEKEKNQSGLLNSYLRYYFKLDKKTLDEVEKEEKEELDKQIKEDFDNVFP